MLDWSDCSRVGFGDDVGVVGVGDFVVDFVCDSVGILLLIIDCICFECAVQHNQNTYNIKCIPLIYIILIIDILHELLT